MSRRIMGLSTVTLGFVVAGAAVAVGGERRARLLRRFDQRGGAFTTWGAHVYSQLAPHLLGGFYERVAGDVAGSLSSGT